MEKQTRREFCTHGCQAASVAALAGALATILEGCGGGSGGGNPAGPSGVAALPVIGASVANNAIALTIDSSSPLAAVGSAALVQTPSVSVLVAHTAQNAFTALSALCTHQACTITGWGSQTFVCPCHGSQFDTSGRVLGGPAPLPLHQYQTQFSNNVLTITG